MTPRRLAGLLAAAALVLVIVAALLLPTPETGGPVAEPRPAPRSPPAVGAAEAAEEEAPAGVEPAPEAAAGADFAEPEERMDFLDRNVIEWLAVVAPEVDPRDVDRTCAPDGRSCTFTGPWPGDDLLARMIRAQGSGEATREDLEGVTFSKLRPEEDEAGNRIFVLEAHAPE